MGPESARLVLESIVIPYKLNYPVAEVIIGGSFFIMVLMDLIIKGMGSTPPYEQQPNQLQLKENGESSYESFPHPEESSEGKGGLSQATSGALATFVLLLALSLHHIFEGMSIGLKENNEDVWKLTVAVILHEIIIAFCLGLQLVSAFGENVTFVTIPGVLCQLMTPIGIMTGILLMEYSEDSDPDLYIANGVLHSISAGVFLYVTFCEILFEQYSAEPTTGKALSMMLGFLMMAPVDVDPGTWSISSLCKRTPLTEWCMDCF